MQLPTVQAKMARRDAWEKVAIVRMGYGLMAWLGYGLMVTLLQVGKKKLTK